MNDENTRYMGEYIDQFARSVNAASTTEAHLSYQKIRSNKSINSPSGDMAWKNLNQQIYVDS